MAICPKCNDQYEEKDDDYAGKTYPADDLSHICFGDDGTLYLHK